jgi:hypothetical protein
MNDIMTYTIQILGQVDEREINALSPLQIHIEWVEARASLLSVRTDQSGIIGLVRHLHNLGLVFLAVCRADAGWPGSSAEAGQLIDHL